MGKMTLTKIRVLLISAAFLPLAACAPEAEFKIYMQDIIDAENGEASQPVKVAIRVPMMSSKSCQEDSSKLVAALGNLVQLDENTSCETEGMSNFLVATATVPMIFNPTDASATTLFPDGVAVSATVTRAETTDTQGNSTQAYGLSIAMKNTVDQMQAVVASADSSFRFSPDLDDPVIRIIFENDSRRVVEVLGNQSFLNGEPAYPVATQAVTLKRRDSVVIEFSNVAANMVSRKLMPVPAAWITPAGGSAL